MTPRDEQALTLAKVFFEQGTINLDETEKKKIKEKVENELDDRLSSNMALTNSMSGKWYKETTQEIIREMPSEELVEHMSEKNLAAQVKIINDEFQKMNLGKDDPNTFMGSQEYRDFFAKYLQNKNSADCDRYLESLKVWEKLVDHYCTKNKGSLSGKEKESLENLSNGLVMCKLAISNTKQALIENAAALAEQQAESQAQKLETQVKELLTLCKGYEENLKTKLEKQTTNTSNLHLMPSKPDDAIVKTNDLYLYQENNKIMYATQTPRGIIRAEITPGEYNEHASLLGSLKNPNKAVGSSFSKKELLEEMQKERERLRKTGEEVKDGPVTPPEITSAALLEITSKKGHTPIATKQEDRDALHDKLSKIQHMQRILLLAPDSNKSNQERLDNFKKYFAEPDTQATLTKYRDHSEGTLYNRIKNLVGAVAQKLGFARFFTEGGKTVKAIDAVLNQERASPQPGKK